MARARDTIPRPDEFRQSLLAGFETCPRRTMHGLRVGDDLAVGWVESTGDLGTVVHAVLAEILRSMWRQGERLIPTQEAIEIMREVYGRGSIVLPTEDRHTLRRLVLKFCAIPFPPQRFAIGAGGQPMIEQRLTLAVECPDGVTRTLKGQPDVILTDPPDGLIIRDWKSGRGKPKEPRDKSLMVTSEETGNTLAIGKEYLSERGHFQLDVYGLLALLGRLDDGTRLMPGVHNATLQEFHLRSGQIRQATLGIEEAREHVLDDIARHLMMLDRAIAEGPKSKLWKPRPGSHCLKQCPVSRSCPIPTEQRGEGALSTQAMADREAAAFVLTGARHEQGRLRLKAWEEAGNPAGRVNDREAVRWGPEDGAWQTKGGGRKFGVYPISNGNGASDGA
jgi:hypothetical protein